MQQWNLYLERTLTNSLVVKAGYVGTKSTRLDLARSPNVPLPGAGNVQSRRPYSNLGAVTFYKSEGFATYHGLELSAVQRFARGLSLSAGYTWSRTIDNRAPTSLDPYNRELDKALSNFHLEHRFFAAGVWELPYGRGRLFGSDIGRLADALLGGWQTSAFMVLATGNPLTVTTLGDNLNTGGGYLQVPDRTAEPNLPASERTRSAFFRTDVFQRPALYTIGNAGRNIIVGPGSRNLDLSVGKRFAMSERVSLQFRAELFNALNHPNWGTPGTTLGTASFGVITSNSNLPRDIQFGLKLQY